MKQYIRKLWHLLGLVTPLVYGSGIISKETALFWTVLAFMVLMVGEALRFAHPRAQMGFEKLFSILMKDMEKEQLNASASFIAGTFLALLLFPRDIACLAIAFLAVGDTAASIVGRLIGRVKIFGSKTLEGTLAFIVSCFLIAVWFVPWYVALSGALLAAVVELFVYRLDDNLTVPVGAGLGMWGAVALFNLF